MAEIFTVETRGIGKPDYSKEVSAGIERAGLYLKEGQSIVTFAILCTAAMALPYPVAHPYAISWVKDRIAIGGTAHLINVSTGVAMPWTLPKGYTVNIIQRVFGGNQDLGIFIYFQPVPGGPLLLVTGSSHYEEGPQLYENMVVPYNSAMFDPTGASAHQIDAVVFNRGGDLFSGGATIVGLLEAVGTPPLPNTKDCQCPFCGYLQTVKVGTTEIVCEKCGQTYYVQDFSTIRKL